MAPPGPRRGTPMAIGGPKGVPWAAEARRRGGGGA
jgi:hypothetical protein